MNLRRMLTLILLAMAIHSAKAAERGTRVHVTWTSVFQEISPQQEINTKQHGTDFYLSGNNHVTFTNDGNNTEANVGEFQFINGSSRQFYTKITFVNGKVLKYNIYRGFRQKILVSTDGVSSCSAKVTWLPNPGKKYLESDLADGSIRTFLAHAENIECAIGNE